MIYIVSGYYRSGTSYKMEQAKAGGMDLHYNPARDDRLNAVLGLGNDHYFEIEDAEFINLLPHQSSGDGLVYGYTASYLESDEYLEIFNQFEGKTIKVLWSSLWRIPSRAKCNIIFMLRNPEEIARSIFKFTEEELSEDWISEYWDNTDRWINALSKNHTVTAINYNRDIESPSFPDSWPVELSSIAKTVRPELYRNRHGSN